MTTSSPPRVSPFEQTIIVDAADIDELGHVNNIVYLRWVQDVAVAHWRSLTTAEEQAAVYWVVLRHEIDFKLSAVIGDVITARTWVGTATGLSFERHTEILRAVDARILARGRTLWCPMDARTGRPVRVSPEIRKRFSVGERQQAPPSAEKG